jgi:hypothetical protein
VLAIAFGTYRRGRATVILMWTLPPSVILYPPIINGLADKSTACPLTSRFLSTSPLYLSSAARWSREVCVSKRRDDES